MTEAVTGPSEDAAQVADAMQAAYFRSVLADHRAHLDAELTKLRSQAETDEEAGDLLALHRLRRQIRGHTSELREVDWLISGLERRYAKAWANQDADIG
jgi:hypothetical protein